MTRAHVFCVPLVSLLDTPKKGNDKMWMSILIIPETWIEGLHRSALCADTPICCCSFSTDVVLPCLG